MRSVYARNKIKLATSETQLTQIRKKHYHHVIVGAFKPMGSKGIYTQFEKAANKFNTLKFVDCADIDYFMR